MSLLGFLVVMALGRVSEAADEVPALEPPAPAVAAPPRDPHHALYVEAAGAALLYSVNYEYRPIPELGGRVGFSAIPLCLFGKCNLYVGGPLAVTAYIGKGSHHLELGGGVTLFVGDDDSRFVVPELGYRYEPPGGGLVLRAMFTPLFRMNDVKDWLPWGGVTAGRSF